MPICKNDKTKTYIGTEPSPKGLGWCAHGEKEGKIRNGKDKNQWIVKKVSNGSKRWMKMKIIDNKYKKYYPSPVYGQKYVVAIKNKDVNIYLDLDYPKNNSNKNYKMIKNYKIVNVFYGKDKKKKINTLLLELPNLEYIFIGGTIYKFKTNEKIIKYFSNTIAGKIYPQPIGLTKNNVYYLEPGDRMIYMPKKYFPKNTTNEDYSNAYDLFRYNPEDTNKKLSNDAKSYKLKGYKSIH
jgi:hypothetical protein